jgi:RimJ/RimL family protein N-acetyltransferase
VPDTAWTCRVPTLTGSLASIREVVPDDAPTLFELLSDPAVAEHLSSPPPSVGAFAGFIEWARRERAAGHSVCFAIVPKGLHEAVGIIQVRALEPTFFTAEWGFAIGAAFWGTGVFIDAANLVAGFAFGTLKVHRLEARAVSQNGRGHGALQKIGARAEGTLTRSFRKGRRCDNQLLWALREDDWRQRPLLVPRLSAEQVSAQIARAIHEARRTIESARPERPSATTAYPFFLTDSSDDPDAGS